MCFIVESTIKEKKKYLCETAQNKLKLPPTKNK